jgi:Raf kinase inhibitor-like YbhB/YbcL family protein
MTMSVLALALALTLAQTSAMPAPTLDDVVVTGQVSVARALIAAGADVNAKDAEGVMPLMRAASAGRGDMVRLLLSSGADPNAKASGAVTALMMASLGGYMDAVAPLIAARSEVAAKDSQGRTALMAAAASGDAAIVEALLKAGADVKAEDASNSTALTYAAAEGHAAAVEALQRHGAAAGHAEMILAAGRCNTAIVRAFLTAGLNIDTADSGTTPLIVAAAGNCVETVDLLVGRGANLNATNADGWTPLMKATSAGNAEIVEKLLAKGADMDVADSLGRTARMYAATANHEEIAAMFQRVRAARPRTGDGLGDRPADLVVSSPVLKASETMPRDYTADGRNVSPPLAWSTVPAGTKSIAVVCADPDAGNPPPFVHWVIYNVPANADRLPENVPFEPNAPMPAEIAGAVQGLSGFRRPIYRGPAPPPGKPHHYQFEVYAVDVGDLKPGLTRAELLDAIKDHVLAQGELVAIYERKP